MKSNLMLMVGVFGMLILLERVCAEESKKVNAQSKVEELKDTLNEIDKVLRDTVVPPKKIVTFPEKVWNFERLYTLEKIEDLPKFGLIPPDCRNHQSGKNLIMLALAINSFGKGVWPQAHGLLGATMLDTDGDALGYESLFHCLSGIHKMQNSYLSASRNCLLLNGVIWDDVRPTKSIINKREGIIYGISQLLLHRHLFASDGNYATAFQSEPGRKNNERLKKALLLGLDIFIQLKQDGYIDKTLRDTLGMAYASLKFDEMLIRDQKMEQLGTLQIYSDAFKATVEKLKKDKMSISHDFLQQLGSEMESRGLAADDKILFPDDDKNFQAILKIIEKDLDIIKK